MMKLTLLTLTALVAQVAAECPNACSGHGKFRSILLSLYNNVESIFNITKIRSI
jgi:hypothetical protein